MFTFVLFISKMEFIKLNKCVTSISLSLSLLAPIMVGTCQHLQIKETRCCCTWMCFKSGLRVKVSTEKASKVPKYFKLADNNVSACSLCKMSLTFPSCTTTTRHRRHLERRRTGATVEGGGCFLLFSCFIVCCAELSSFDEIVFC